MPETDTAAVAPALRALEVCGEHIRTEFHHGDPERTGRVVATVPGFDDASDAYRRLFAGSPLLLAAARGAVAMWDRLYPSFPLSAAIEDAEFAEVQALRLAIARATGGAA